MSEAKKKKKKRVEVMLYPFLNHVQVLNKYVTDPATTSYHQVPFSAPGGN